MRGTVVSCDTELRIRESTVKQSISGLEEEIKCHSGEIPQPTYIPLLRRRQRDMIPNPEAAFQTSASRNQGVGNNRRALCRLRLGAIGQIKSAVVIA